MKVGWTSKQCCMLTGNFIQGPTLDYLILLSFVNYSTVNMSAIGLSDISPSQAQKLDPHSVQWVKSNIKAYKEPGQPMDTNGFGECRFLGATRKAKAKVLHNVHLYRQKYHIFKHFASILMIRYPIIRFFVF